MIPHSLAGAASYELQWWRSEGRPVVWWTNRCSHDKETVQGPAGRRECVHSAQALHTGRSPGEKKRILWDQDTVGINYCMYIISNTDVCSLRCNHYDVIGTNKIKSWNNTQRAATYFFVDCAAFTAHYIVICHVTTIYVTWFTIFGRTSTKCGSSNLVKFVSGQLWQLLQLNNFDVTFKRTSSLKCWSWTV